MLNLISDLIVWIFTDVSRKSIGEKGLCVKRKNVKIALVVKGYKPGNTYQIIYKDDKNQYCFF